MARRYRKQAAQMVRKGRREAARGDDYRAMMRFQLAKCLDPMNADVLSDLPPMIAASLTQLQTHLAHFGPVPDRAAQQFQHNADYIDALCQKPQADESMPKRIWIYWAQGLDDAPDVVQKSYQSWVKLNPDYEVTFLDNTTLDDYLGFEWGSALQGFSAALKLAGQSDLIRLVLLARYGGVWVDATTFCLKPLNTWLEPAVDKTGFFCFRQNASRRTEDRTLISWFLASTPNHPIVQSLLKAAFAFLSKDRPEPLVQIGQARMRVGLAVFDPPGVSMTGTGAELIEFAERHGFYLYFWLFYLFNDVVAKPEIAETWAQVLTLPNQFAQPFVDEDTFRQCCVSKQTYRGDFPESDEYKFRVKYLTRIMEEYDASLTPS